MIEFFELMNKTSSPRVTLYLIFITLITFIISTALPRIIGSLFGTNPATIYMEADGNIVDVKEDNE